MENQNNNKIGQENNNIEDYTKFIVDQLRLCPQIRQTNLYYKLRENFKDFNFGMRAFYRSVNKIRDEYDLPQFRKKPSGIRAKSIIGQEAQVDFGQFRMKNFYGSWVKVYFFCMVLSYSNFRFVYFEPKPFTTVTAIKAHDLAFQFFGGRTKQIMYDLDPVFTYAYNYGDIIFVKEFEDYVRKVGFQAVFCKPHEPDTKGRVENLVNYVKQGFLTGRIYTGIDSLNNDCLKWLDDAGNNSLSGSLPYAPRDLFREEIKHLMPVAKFPVEQIVYSIDKNNTVRYKCNRYEMPLGSNFIYVKAEIELQDDVVVFKDVNTLKEICRHILQQSKGNIIKAECNKPSSVAVESLTKKFEGSKTFDEFYKKLQVQMPNQIVQQASAINRACAIYEKSQIFEALKYCVKADVCNFTQLMGCLIYLHGRALAKKFLSKQKVSIYVKRAKEIELALNGKNSNKEASLNDN